VRLTDCEFIGTVTFKSHFTYFTFKKLLRAFFYKKKTNTNITAQGHKYVVGGP